VVEIKTKQLKGYQFYRQKIIGKYIVDFCCPKANLVIELDGGQHYNEIGKRKDQLRGYVITKIGVKILRFSDRDVFENLNGVLEYVWGHL